MKYQVYRRHVVDGHDVVTVLGEFDRRDLANLFQHHCARVSGFSDIFVREGAGNRKHVVFNEGQVTVEDV